METLAFPEADNLDPFVLPPSTELEDTEVDTVFECMVTELTELDVAAAAMSTHKQSTDSKEDSDG